MRRPEADASGYLGCSRCGLSASGSCTIRVTPMRRVAQLPAYADQREEIFEQWLTDITDIAACPNVVAKLGGLAMPDNGFGWNTAERPPTSRQFVVAQARYYVHTIEAFGPDRCMFESNFPVDRFSMSYRTLWNGLKLIAGPYSESERDLMFRGTAATMYRL